jgi:hypothetical protein
MKNYLALIALAISLLVSSQTFASNSTGVDEKISKVFYHTFPTAVNVQWDEINGMNVVHFEDGGNRSIVYYDKQGNFLNSIRYYNAENLPLNILFKVREKYASMQIFGVTEISNGENIAYFIKMEDNSNWLTLKSGPSGSLEVYEKYRKMK